MRSAAVLVTVAVAWMASLASADNKEDEAKLKEIQKALRKPSSPAALRLVMDDLFRLMDGTVLDDNYALASKAATVAVDVAVKLNSQHAVYRVTQRKDEIRKISAEYKKLSPALKKLSADADDATANRAVGLFRLLVKEETVRGASQLEAAESPVLAELAQKELQKPTQPQEQIALGKMWREAAEKETGLVKQRMERRAYMWYQQALRQSTGQERAPINLAMDEFPFRYLTDIDEAEAVQGSLGRYGALGRGDERITVDGIKYELGLGMAVPKEYVYFAKFQLNGLYKTFNAGCALNDMDEKRTGHIYFIVKGDGRELWKSSGLIFGNAFQTCSVNIKGVQMLELRTESPDQTHGGFGAWLDPYVAK